MFGHNIVSLTANEEDRITGSGSKVLNKGFLTYDTIARICADPAASLNWEDPRKKDPIIYMDPNTKERQSAKKRKSGSYNKKSSNAQNSKKKSKNRENNNK